VVLRRDHLHRADRAAGDDLARAQDRPVEAVAVADEQPDAAGWISVSCRDGARLNGGAPIEEAVAALDGEPGVVAVGVNCTPPEHLDELIARIRAVTSLPILAYPNSGEGWDAVARRWTGTGSGRVDAEAALRWRRLGATLVGGCCRVSPDQVAALAPAMGPGLAAGMGPAG
jgi:homocysteine S-methyltransferase